MAFAKLSSLSYLFKSIVAAIDIPEYAHKWVHEDKRLESVPKLQDVKKVIANHIPPFRDAVQLDFSKLEEVQNAKAALLRALTDEVKSVRDTLDSEAEYLKDDGEDEKALHAISASEACKKVIEQLPSLASELMLGSAINYESAARKKLPKPVMDKKTGKEITEVPMFKFQVNAGASLKVVLDNLYTFVKKTYPEADIIPFDFVPESAGSKKTGREHLTDDQKAYVSVVEFNSSKSENVQVVFSTDARDVLSMSSRSDWVSCQNLLVPKNQNNRMAVDTALNPNSGIIYLTKGDDFEGRGEKMIARCLVFLVFNKRRQPALFLGAAYSNSEQGSSQNTYLREVFTEVIKKHTSLPYVEEGEGYTLDISSGEPYMDSGFQVETEDKINDLKERFLLAAGGLQKVLWGKIFAIAQKRHNVNLLNGLVNDIFDIGVWFRKPETIALLESCAKHGDIHQVPDMLYFLTPDELTRVLKLVRSATEAESFRRLIREIRNENASVLLGITDDELIAELYMDPAIFALFPQEKTLQLAIDHRFDHLPNARDVFTRILRDFPYKMKMLILMSNDVALECVQDPFRHLMDDNLLRDLFAAGRLTSPDMINRAKQLKV